MKNKLFFFIVGFLGGFVYPPFSMMYPIVSVLCLSLYLSYLLYLIDKSRSARQAFWKMFWLSEISYILAFSWILKPFYFLENMPSVLVQFLSYTCLFLLTAFLTLFIEFSGIVVFKTKPKYRYFMFAVSVAFFEWVRGWLFTGLPWNPIALVWADVPIVLQVLSLFGPYALTFMTVFVLSLPYLLLYKKDWKNYNVLGAVCLCLFVVCFGGWRIHKYSGIRDNDFKLRLIDANIPQHLVYNRNVVDVYEKLIKLDGWKDIDLFVLPETSSPYDLTNNGYYQMIYSNFNNDKSSLVVGFNRYDNFDEVSEDYDVYNSFAVLNRDGVQYVYDKKHLVPFGEYIPFKRLIPFKKFTAGVKDFSKGEKREAFIIGEQKFLPLICYEVIFSGLFIADDIDALINISNDAWFGESGKYQHFALSRFRAVEEGVSLIRVSNDGAVGGKAVSVVSPLGIERDAINSVLEEKFSGYAVKDFVLPARVSATLFSKFGNFPFIIFCFIVFVLQFRLWQYLDFTKKKQK